MKEDKKDRVFKVNVHLIHNPITVKTLEEWKIQNALFELKFERYEFMSYNKELDEVLENGLYCFGGEDRMLADEEIVEACNGDWDIDTSLSAEAYTVPLTLNQCTIEALGKIEEKLGLQECSGDRYLCWDDNSYIDDTPIFEVWDKPKKENSYCLASIYCPTCGDKVDGLIFHNLESADDPTIHFEEKHAYCCFCKTTYYVHELIN